MVGARLATGICLGLGVSGCWGRDGLNADLGDSSEREPPILRPRLEIVELMLPEGRVGEPYRGQARATDSHFAYTWSVVEGSLPPGLEASPDTENTLSVAGIPTLSGRYAGQVRVEVDTGEVATQRWQITIRPKRWIAYAARQRLDEPDTVYVVDTERFAEPVMVGPSRDEQSRARSLFFSPSGDLLVYDMDGLKHVVDLRGTAPGAPEFASRCSGWQWAPDESSVLCRWNDSLVWAPIRDGKFGETGATGDHVRSSAWSPQGSRYAFSEQAGLLVVDMAEGVPGPPQGAHPPLVAGGHVSFWSFAPDGRWLVYEADAEQDDVYELYALRMRDDGWGMSVKLNLTLTLGGDVGATVPGEEFDWVPPVWAPDSNHLAFVADSESDQEYVLFVVDMSGEEPGSPRAVTAPVDPAVELRKVTWVSEKHIAYETVTYDPYDQDLFLVDVSSAPAPSAWQLNDAERPGNTVLGPVAAPDGLALVYGDGDFGDSDQVSWYWVDFRSGERSVPVLLYTSRSWNSGLRYPQFGPKTSLLAFSSDGDRRGVDELYLINLGDAPLGPPFKAHPSAAASERGLRCEPNRMSCQDFWRADARYIAYLLSPDDNDRYELFVVDTAGGDPKAPRKISHPLGTGGSVTQFAWPHRKGRHCQDLACYGLAD